MRNLVLAAALVSAAAPASAANVLYGFSEVRTDAYTDPRLGPNGFGPERSGTFLFDTDNNRLLSFNLATALDFSPNYPREGQLISEAVIELFDSKTNGTCDLACFVNAVNTATYFHNYTPEVLTITFGGAVNGSVVGRAPVNTVYQAYERGTFRVSGAVPEPGTWALMLLGFGAIGYSLRQRRRVTALPA